MRIRHALLADFANVTDEGKLNIIGVTDEIEVTSFPAASEPLMLVLVLEAESADDGRTVHVDLNVADPTDSELVLFSTETVVPTEPPASSRLFDLIIEVHDLEFDRPGTYQLRVVVNNDIAVSLPLWVRSRLAGESGP